MFSCLRQSAFSKFISATVGILVVACTQASNLLPLNDETTSLYPFSSVGIIKSSDGLKGNGTIVSDNAIITCASNFQSYIGNGEKDHSFTFTLSDGSISQSKEWVLFDNSQASKIDQSKDLMLIKFEDHTFSDQAVQYNINQLQNASYRMAVAYTSDLYSGNNQYSEKLHATNAGEPTNSEFGKVLDRLFHTGDLKGPPGAPVFSFTDNNWSMSGIIVEQNKKDGSSIVICVDDSVSEFIKNNSNRATNPSHEYTDPNEETNRASELILGHGKNFSIYPASDIDYHKIEVAEEGNYTIASYGDLDVSGRLLNSSRQTIIEDHDSNGSFNYSMNILLKKGTYYLRTSPNSANDVGTYGISFVQDDTTNEYSDDGFPNGSVIDLDANTTDAGYRIQEPGEIDYFRVIINTPGTIKIWTEGDLDTKGSIVSISANASTPFKQSDITKVYATNDDYKGAGSNFLISKHLETGDYVIMIQARNAGEFGPYKLNATFN